LRKPIAAVTALFCLALIMTGRAVGASGGKPAAVKPPGLPQTGAQFGAYIQVNSTWTGPDRRTAQLNVEAAANRTFGIDRQFYRWDDVWPTADDTWSAASGRTLILSWGSARNGGSFVRWADIAAGVYDATIDQQATNIINFGYPFWFVFHHEPQNGPPGGGSYGTPAEFIAAWKHIRDRFTADGVTNIRYLLVLFASTFQNGQADLYYPGDQYTDAVGADGYNWYQCGGPWQSVQQVFKEFYNWGLAHRKPLIVAEWGTGEDPADPLRKGQWFTDALPTFEAWPEIKAISYYDTGKNPLCLRWITTPNNDPAGPSATAFAGIGVDPYFNPAPDTTAPVAKVDLGPPSQTVSTTATLSWSASELGVRYVCSLDGSSAAPCYDFTTTYSGLALGTHTFTVRATDYSGNVGPVATWTWTIANPNLAITITDSAFTPSTASPLQGQTVTWTVSSSATQTHQVIDNSGMGLYVSPILSAGQSYSFTFAAAGTYKYKDNLHPTLIGTINILVWAVPLTGSLTTNFTVNWASGAPAPGYLFDVQIQRLGGTWQTWRYGQTATSAIFVADSGVGTYSFRSRYRNTANGKSSTYSPPFSITVS
jgi:plastocyanin